MVFRGGPEAVHLPLKSGYRLKRQLDIIIALTLFSLLFPLMLVVAVLVKLTSPGPILFRQVRTGINTRRRPDRRQLVALTEVERRGVGIDRRKKTGYGRPFVMLKFRTMRLDAERNGAQFAVKGDTRVTPIGRFLRRSRIDELPQLWNILIGDMSMVGPRPERPEFIEELSSEIPDYLDRLGMRPGLTGLAQVVNGYDNDIEGFRRKVQLDLEYSRKCCLWYDLKILFSTISVVLTGRGAL